MIWRCLVLQSNFSVVGEDITPTLKLKRSVVQEKYKDIVEELYK